MVPFLAHSGSSIDELPIVLLPILVFFVLQRLGRRKTQVNGATVGARAEGKQRRRGVRPKQGVGEHDTETDG